jgi:sarcosine oxidase subunit beta
VQASEHPRTNKEEELPRKADYVIIGAGVMGASIAYHLAKSGAKRIVLLEKKTPASGPSGKSHAVMPQYYTIEALARLTSESWRFYQDFGKITGKEPVFHGVGIIFAYQELLAERFERNALHVRKWDLSPKIINSGEIRDISPNFYIPEYYAAAYDKDGGYVDAHLAVEGFVSAAGDLGVHLSPHTEVLGLDADNGEVRGVITDNGGLLKTKSLP